MLTIEEITYSHQGKRILHSFTHTFSPGKIYGVVGPNGSGKSTLLKTISNIWSPSSGSIFWQEKDLHQLSRQEISNIIHLVPQNPNPHFAYTVYEMVAMKQSISGQQNDNAVLEAIIETDLFHLKDRPVNTLSGGERQRTYIARSKATNCPVLLLDEHTGNLDLHHQLRNWNYLLQLKKRGHLIVVALHQLEEARRYCDELIVLQHGVKIADGPFDKVITPKLLEEVFHIQKSLGTGIYSLIDP